MSQGKRVGLFLAIFLVCCFVILKTVGLREPWSNGLDLMECEEKLKQLIVEMKAEIAEAKRLKGLGKGNGQPMEGKKGKRARKGE